MSKKDKDDAMWAMLEEGIKATFTDEKYVKCLETMAKFTNYSAGNCVLLAEQGAVWPVASYTNWRDKFHRTVIPGETALWIIAPTEKTVNVPIKDAEGNPVLSDEGNPVVETKKVKGFRRACVFGVNQTEGAPLPTICDELKGPVDAYEDYMYAIQQISPAPISFGDLFEAKGQYDSATKIITIQRGMDDLQNIKTAIHEVAHAIIHDKDNGLAPESSRNVKELQAESIAYVISKRLGLDTAEYSFPYIASYSAHDHELKQYKSCLDLIKKVADTMYNGIIHCLKEQMEIQKESIAKIEPINPTGMGMAM